MMADLSKPAKTYDLEGNLYYGGVLQNLLLGREFILRWWTTKPITWKGIYTTVVV